jgi:trehalose synthase-fused probable maltokinase
VPEYPKHDAVIERLCRSLPSRLPGFLRGKRWFAGKAETIRSVEIRESIPFPATGIAAYLFLVAVQYGSGSEQQYALPLKAVPPGDVPVAPSGDSGIVIGPEGGFPGCILTDAMEDGRFAQWLLEGIRRGVSLKGNSGDVVATPTPALHALAHDPGASLAPSVMRVEQSNTSINYGGKLMLKFFRRAEEGISLDFETGIFLTQKAGFKHTPEVAGCIEYRRAGHPPVVLGVLQGFVRNQGDAWNYTLRNLEGYFDRVSEFNELPPGDSTTPASLLELAASQPPPFARETIGAYLSSVALLGRRTAEMHLALSSDSSDPQFAPEPFSFEDWRSACDSMEQLTGQAFRLLKERSGFLAPPVREQSQRVLSRKQEVVSRFRRLLILPVTVQRTRLHGDYHLGQVLFTGTDFVIIDFEGEPERPLAERRDKGSPLRDAAGMLRSFHYASSSALRRVSAPAIHSGPIHIAHLDRWRRYWKTWVSAQFLNGYLETAGKTAFLPQDLNQLEGLLNIFLIDKAVYEVIYELKNRPDWVTIPLEGILELLPGERPY